MIRSPRFLPRGIRERLFLLMVLVLVPLLILFYRMYQQRYDARFQQAMQTEVEVAHGIATTFATHIHDIRRLTHAIGQGIITISRNEPAEAASLLAKALDGYPTIRNLSWASPDGKVVASTDTNLLRGSFAHRAYFQKAITGKTWAIGPLTEQGARTPAPTFAMATAIVDKGGTVVGAVVAGIEPTRVGEVILTHERPADGAFAIFDNNGTLVYRNPEKPMTWETRTRWKDDDPVLLRAIQSGTEQTGVTHPAFVGTDWMSARVPIREFGWVAGAGRPVKTAMAPVLNDFLPDTVITLVLSSLAFLLAYLVSRTISTPLVALEREAGRTEEEISPEEDPFAPMEVNRLRRTLADMTDRLRRSRKRLRLAIDNIPDVITIYDRDMRIRYINPASTATTGRPPEEFIGRSEDEVWPDHYRMWRPQMEAAFRDGKVQTVELEFEGPTGLRSIQVIGVPLPDETGRVQEVMGITHDLTQWKQAERELRHTLEELTRSNRELEQFAYVSSHDLQEPLRMVASYVQLLGRKYQGQLDPDADKYIGFAVEGAKRMQNLIDDLLAFSRIARTINMVTVDMGTVVAEATANLGLAIAEAGAEVTAGALPTVTGDRTQLVVLLQNLISNGIKYRRDGVVPRVSVTAELRGDEWVFSVADNGIGIEREYADRIFLIFQRLHPRDKYPGTGIGLATCRKIVEVHHGQIWVESEPEKGATFFFTIPATRRT